MAKPNKDSNKKNRSKKNTPAKKNSKSDKKNRKPFSKKHFDHVRDSLGRIVVSRINIANKPPKKPEYKINLPVIDSETGLEYEIKSIDSNIYYYNPTEITFNESNNFARAVDAFIESNEPTVQRNYDLVIPFDPSLIRVAFRQVPIDMLLTRIRQGALLLDHDFQRSPAIWDEVAQSRLIESVLIKIPLPVFYIDASEDDNWRVIDGLQRLATFKRFVIDQTLKLKNLEFLKELEGLSFNELPRNYQRRISESQISLYQIESGTPPEVTLSIFKRINTGGLPLSAQEIRHALFPGAAPGFLNELVHLPSFIQATADSIADGRMTDRECVLRFIAFFTKGIENYKSKDIDGFLNDGMKHLNKCSPTEREYLKSKFDKSMQLAYSLFGEDAFRKRFNKADSRNPINRALFDTWSVCLAELNEREKSQLEKNKGKLLIGFMSLMRDSNFENSITAGTSEVRKVQYRFRCIKELIRKNIT